jgi:hypothetical protein
MPKKQIDILMPEKVEVYKDLDGNLHNTKTAAIAANKAIRSTQLRVPLAEAIVELFTTMGYTPVKNIPTWVDEQFEDEASKKAFVQKLIPLGTAIQNVVEATEVPAKKKAAPVAGDKPKRKRRTKAEMEAARAAEAASKNAVPAAPAPKAPAQPAPPTQPPIPQAPPVKGEEPFVNPVPPLVFPE